MGFIRQGLQMIFNWAKGHCFLSWISLLPRYLWCHLQCLQRNHPKVHALQAERCFAKVWDRRLVFLRRRFGYGDRSNHVDCRLKMTREVIIRLHECWNEFEHIPTHSSTEELTRYLSAGRLGRCHHKRSDHWCQIWHRATWLETNWDLKCSLGKLYIYYIYVYNMYLYMYIFRMRVLYACII